jgi:hypothetical protein
MKTVYTLVLVALVTAVLAETQPEPPIPTISDIERVEISRSSVWGNNWSYHYVDNPSAAPSHFRDQLVPALKDQLHDTRDSTASIGHFYKEQFPVFDRAGRMNGWVYPKTIHNRGSICYYRIKSKGTWTSWAGPIAIDFSKFRLGGTEYNQFQYSGMGGRYLRPWHGITIPEYKALINDIVTQYDIPTWEVSEDLYLTFLYGKTGKDWRAVPPSKPSTPVKLEATTP